MDLDLNFRKWEIFLKLKEEKYYQKKKERKKEQFRVEKGKKWLISKGGEEDFNLPTIFQISHKNNWKIRRTQLFSISSFIGILHRRRTVSRHWQLKQDWNIDIIWIVCTWRYHEYEYIHTNGEKCFEVKTETYVGQERKNVEVDKVVYRPQEKCKGKKRKEYFFSFFWT